MSAALDCPLCGAVVVEGRHDITPGACTECGAMYEGGEGDAPAAVASALVRFGADDLSAPAVLDAVFRLTPAESVERGIAITSDRRDDFYCWWLFVRAVDGDHHSVLRSLIT